MERGQPLRMDRSIRWMDFGSAALVFLQRLAEPALAAWVVNLAPVLPPTAHEQTAPCRAWPEPPRCVVSMCPAASHDERRMVLLARLRVAPDCRFPAHPALRGSAAVLSAANHPQDGFPAAPHEDDPAQTVSLRGIPLFAWHRRDGLAPVALVSVCSVAVAVLVGCVYPPYADAAYSLSTARMAQHDAPMAVPT